MGFNKTFEHDAALYRAAVDEFVAQGFEQASLNTILKTAGMSKGQFYYHFGNKEGLYLALVAGMIAAKRSFLAATLPPDALRGDLFGNLRTLLAHGIAFARAHPEIDRFATAFINEQGNPIYARVLAHYNLNDDTLLEMLVQQAALRGDLRPDLPLPFIQKLVGYLFTHAADVTSLSGAADADANLNHLIAFLQSGLARNAAGQEDV